MGCLVGSVEGFTVLITGLVPGGPLVGGQVLGGYFMGGGLVPGGPNVGCGLVVVGGSVVGGFSVGRKTVEWARAATRTIGWQASMLFIASSSSAEMKN